MQRWLPKLFLPVLFIGLFAVHFSDGNVRQRKLINYDDLDLVRPMLSMSLNEYFTEWLPNRNNHAYPLRDMTYFIDRHISDAVGFKVYWITQVVLFFLVLLFSLRLYQKLWPDKFWLPYILTALFAFHPATVEVVQWLTIRKHLMAILFLIPASTVILTSRGKALKLKEWSLVIGLYLASILCFPTGLLWLPWALWMQREHFSKRQKWISAVAAMILLLIYWRWTTVGEADYAARAKDLFSGKSVVQWLYLAVLCLGRGTFNLLFPFQPVTFYREDHVFNYAGLAIFAFLAYRIYKLRGADTRSFATLVAITLAPSALVFLGFSEFVWADRYIFTILPFALPLLAPLAMNMKLKRQSILALAGVWLAVSIFVSIRYVPVWRDAVGLMKNCADREKSAKCAVQTVMRGIHTEGCRPLAPYLKMGREIFQTRKPPYNREFHSDMPFYDALCITLSTSLSPKEKLEQLPFLFDIYEGAGEVMFSIILAGLEAGDISGAYQNAKTYFLSGDSRPMISSRNNINTFKGSAKAICEIMQDRECEARRLQFIKANGPAPKDMGYENWGYQITQTMWKRRLEQSARQ